MEQHSQARTRQRAPQEDRQREKARQSPEQARLAAAGLTARAALAGAPLWDLPPAGLEAMAGLLGNQAMAGLLDRQGPAAEEILFRLPPEGLETAPFPVPETPAALVPAPEGLAAAAVPAQAFDPAGLWA